MTPQPPQEPGAPAEEFVFLQGARAVGLALASPRGWSAELQRRGPGLDADFSLTTLEPPAAAAVRNLVIGSAAAGLLFWTAVTVVGVYAPEWYVGGRCFGLDAGACVQRFHEHLAIAATAVLILGIALGFAVSLRAGLVALIFGSLGIDSALRIAFTWWAAQPDTVPDSALRALGPLITGAACGLAVGGAGATTQWGGRERRTTVSLRQMLLILLDAAIPVVLVLCLAALFVVLLEPLLHSDAIADQLKGMDVKRGLLAGYCALVLASPAIFATWRRSVPGARGTHLGSMRWVLLLLAALGAALGAAPPHKPGYGIAIGILVGTVVSITFLFVWQWLRERLGPRAAARTSTAAIVLIIVGLVWKGPVADATRASAPVIAAVAPASVLLGFLAITATGAPWKRRAKGVASPGGTPAPGAPA